ncbi:hypothetical protein ACP3WT_28035, partial [Salmonella enterica]|uniref:hypothetical protein n=1 Tax=Salmonella enterica TaxID=28901 RepID=UPI003CE7F08A
ADFRCGLRRRSAVPPKGEGDDEIDKEERREKVEGRGVAVAFVVEQGNQRWACDAGESPGRQDAAVDGAQAAD